MSGNRSSDFIPTDYEEYMYWSELHDNPEQFAQQRPVEERPSMLITESGVQTSQYVSDTDILSNHYILPSSDLQYHPDPENYQQSMQYPFPQSDLSLFHFQVSQHGTVEHVPITQPVLDPYATGDIQATHRRFSLQPPQPQTSYRDTRSRSASLATPAWSSSPDTAQGDTISRTASPGAAEPEQYGHPVGNGSWRCSYPECKSTKVFGRACDLRKHHKRHSKQYFCSYSNCQHHSKGGFSSKKDCERHQASHNPSIACEHPECTRIFSRRDNMRDHMRRTHNAPPVRTRRGTS